MRNRSSVFAALALLLLISSVASAAGRSRHLSRHFMGRKEYRPYTRNLPAITKVEILKLETKDDRWTGGILGTSVLTGARAQNIASLWRQQTYTSSLSACHNPAYAVKFYSHRKLLVYASVCWSCNSIFMISPKSTRTQSFRGYEPRGEHLSDLFEAAFATGK